MTSEEKFIFCENSQICFLVTGGALLIFPPPRTKKLETFMIVLTGLENKIEESI